MGWKIAFYYPGLKMMNSGDGGGRGSVSDVSFIRAIFLTCSVSLCQVSDRRIVEDCDDSLFSSMGFCEPSHSI